MPGTLVSIRKGSRFSVQFLGRRPSRIRSGPVRMKPGVVDRSTSPGHDVGVGHGADEDEDRVGRHGFALAGVLVLQGDGLEVVVAGHLGHLGVRP